MDDRIRRGNSEKGEETNISSGSIREEQNKPFTVNIDSNSDVEKLNPTGHKVKRFEVHIPENSDFYDTPEQRNDTPTRIPAPVRRPVSPAELSKNRPTRPSGNPMPRKRVATGVPGPISPEAQQASKKAAEMRAKEKQKQQKQQEKNAAKLDAQKKKSDKKLEKKAAKQAEKKEKNKNFGYNFAKGLLITCVCVIFVGTIVAVVSSVAFSFINDILAIDDENKNYSVTVEIPEGATYETIFDILVEKGLVAQPLLTDFFCKFRHYDYESYLDEETGAVINEPVEYQPGVYHIDADSGIENILNSMLVYNNVTKDTVRVTIPEGYTIAEAFAKLEKYDVCEAQKLYANLDIVAQQYDFISSIVDIDGRYSKAEGYLFPDTYDFYIGENASSVLEKLFSNFADKWTVEYDNRLKSLGYTKDQVITIASIIQAEAKDGTQMAAIASVIYNRLNNSASYPTIDMDSTSDYVKILKGQGLISEVQNAMYGEAYNTYSQIGLPPGPICNPGASAIKAALYPDESDYFFFFHDENGTIYLSSNITEHEQKEQSILYGNVGEVE